MKKKTAKKVLEYFNVEGFYIKKSDSNYHRIYIDTEVATIGFGFGVDIHKEQTKERFGFDFDNASKGFSLNLDFKELSKITDLYISLMEGANIRRNYTWINRSLSIAYFDERFTKLEYLNSRRTYLTWDRDINSLIDKKELLVNLFDDAIQPKLDIFMSYQNYYNYIEPKKSLERYNSQFVLDRGLHIFQRLALKAILKTDDYQFFKKFVYDIHTEEEKRVTKEYFDLLDKIYQDETRSKPDKLVQPSTEFYFPLVRLFDGDVEYLKGLYNKEIEYLSKRKDNFKKLDKSAPDYQAKLKVEKKVTIHDTKRKEDYKYQYESVEKCIEMLTENPDLDVIYVLNKAYGEDKWKEYFPFPFAFYQKLKNQYDKLVAENIIKKPQRIEEKLAGFLSKFKNLFK